jgi:hypothetical protein
LVNKSGKLLSVVVLDDRKTADRKMGRVLVNRIGEFVGAADFRGGIRRRSSLSALALRVGIGGWCLWGWLELRVGVGGRCLLSSLALRVGVKFGEKGRHGEGEFWDEVFGDVGGGEAWSGGLDAADVRSLHVKAVAEEAEYLLDVLLEGADDVFFELGLSAAMLADHAADGLGLVEEATDFVDEGALAAEIDGALSAVFAPGEAVVGTEASAAVGSPGGDDGPLGGEAGGFFAEEGEGGVVSWVHEHVYMYSGLAGFINRRSEHSWRFLEGDR